MNKKTEKVTPVRETGCTYSLAWSPDGKTLAYVMSRGIYLVDADGTNRRLLTSGKVYEYAPMWSPDGKLLAYAAPQPFANVHVINVETGEDRQLTNAKRYESPGAWSQCGKFIKTRYNLFGKRRFEVLDLDGKKAEATLASELKWQPGVGSSGKHRFYHVDGAYTIENPAKDADAAPTPHQRPEEKASLTVKSMGKRHSEIFLVNADSGKEKQLTFLPHSTKSHVSWSPTRQQILFKASVFLPERLRQLLRHTDGVFSKVYYVMNADGSECRPLGSQPIYSVQWVSLK